MPSKSPRCPLCGKPRDPEFKPFCSRGCRDRDLLNWFGEDYRVPVDQARQRCAVILACRRRRGQGHDRLIGSGGRLVQDDARRRIL